MSVRDLETIFRPRRVAVVGAGDRPGSVGGAVLSNLLEAGFRGAVYPVNPRHEAVGGIHAYPTVGDLPARPDLAVVCTPPDTVPDVVEDCGRAGVRGLVVLTAGFGEAGGEGRQRAERLRETLARYPATRLVGPNCVGVIVPRLGLNASFAAGTPRAGRLAFVSQSGALCTAVLDWAVQQGIGFSHFISVGNMLDVDFGDLIDYLGGDEDTASLLLYVESITNARKFLSAARAFARTKPIVAYKAGRFADSARAAASHTGAMAGEDDVYAAAFRRAGIERVEAMGDLFDCADLLARQRPPAGPRLAIVTNAGGPAVIATDALLARQGVLAELSAETMRRLDAALPPQWSHGNPVDCLGDASAERLAEALRAVLADEGVDGVLVVLAPQAITDPTDAARAVTAIAQKAEKPVLAAWMGGRRMQQGFTLLTEAGVPAYRNAEDSVDAYMHLVSYARNLEVLHETPRDLAGTFSIDRAAVDDVLRDASDGGVRILAEDESKRLLAACGVPVTATARAATADEAARRAAEAGYPVVLKVLSPQISHKTDVGGVALDLRDDDAVRRAFARITAAAAEARPDARIDGVTVQPMRAASDGVELILGMKRDPAFGAAILVGTGGTAAEIFGDRALELPPLTERLARRMLESLRAWPLLRGHRGRPPVDVDALTEALVRFSYLVAEMPALREMDVNPLLATPGGVEALDARVVLDPALVRAPPRAFGHLAIRPYPDEFVSEARLPDGTPVTLRPIKPEDEPRWHELLATCSPDSLWFRFGSLIKRTTHRMAARYCFIDYDRELAIVPEVTEDGRRRLIAVGRLVADPDHETAEYAILVGDPWQGRGVGALLTEYCLRVARTWGIGRVVAQTSPANRRMLRIFEELGFELKHAVEDGVVRVSLDRSRFPDAAPG